MVMVVLPVGSLSRLVTIPLPSPLTEWVGLLGLPLKFWLVWFRAWLIMVLVSFHQVGPAVVLEVAVGLVYSVPIIALRLLVL